MCEIMSLHVWCLLEVCWFAERVPRETLPWICSTKHEKDARGGATSTTTELVALVVLMDFRMDDLAVAGTHGFGLTLSAEGGDSAGCSYILRKMYTSSEPGASLMRYVAKRCIEQETWTSVTWIPREKNEWADILSKGWEGGPRELERRQLFQDGGRRRVSWARYQSITDDVALLGSPLEVGGRDQMGQE